MRNNPLYYPSQTIAHEQWNWRLTIEGRDVDLPLDIQIAPGALDATSQSPTILLGGYGEGARSTTAGLRALRNPDGLSSGLAAIGVVTLPYRMLEPTPANLERVLVEGPLFVTNEVQQHIGSRPGSKSSLLGRSGGGGIAILSAHSAPELFDCVGALSPVGVTSEFMGSTHDEVRREFRRRVARNMLRAEQSPFRSGNIRAALEIGMHAFEGNRLGRVVPELNFGLNQEGPRIIQELVTSGVQVGILGAERDIFLPNEYRRALGGVGLEGIFTEVPGSHANSLSRAGREQMGRLAYWLMQAKVASR